MAAIAGLHVLATERHETHRIDRQLYGRAARQGDAGSRQAFVSLEAELVKRFVPGVARLQVESVVRHERAPAEKLASAASRNSGRNEWRFVSGGLYSSTTPGLPQLGLPHCANSAHVSFGFAQFLREFRSKLLPFRPFCMIGTPAALRLTGSTQSRCGAPLCSTKRNRNRSR